jgi:DNA-directed RNA polymerase subunit RPC12/RpoP
MAFYPYIVSRALVRAQYRCEACGREWLDLKDIFGDTPLHGHSSISLHAIRNQKTGLYRATSVPPGLERMKGRVLKPDKYYFQKYGRSDDAYMLCPECHLRVHELERIYSSTRIKTGDGKNPIPYYLELITLEFIDRKGEWNF